MCGRYDNLIARDAYRGLFKANRLPKSNFPLRYNIAPTDQIPIVRIDRRDGEREVVMARWGLIPFWIMRRSIGRTFSRSGANSLSFAVIRLVSVVRSPDIALVAPHPWTQLHILRQIENMGVTRWQRSRLLPGLPEPNLETPYRKNICSVICSAWPVTSQPEA
jgi:hypothetical protein